MSKLNAWLSAALLLLLLPDVTKSSIPKASGVAASLSPILDPSVSAQPRATTSLFQFATHQPKKCSVRMKSSDGHWREVSSICCSILPSHFSLDSLSYVPLAVDGFPGGYHRASWFTQVEQALESSIRVLHNLESSAPKQCGSRSCS